jgi:Na+-translocating ferredoxin:NAD+ oxidoreductase RnfD subunit
MKLSFKSVKVQLATFLLAFALYIAIKDNNYKLFISLASATFLTILIEGIFLFFEKKKPDVSESAVITGLILGFVLALDQHSWFGIYAAAAALAIASKHILRFNKRHLFNPATFGVVVAMFLLGAQTAWVGTYCWYLLMPAGIYFAYRMGKLEVLIGYGITACGLFVLQDLIKSHEIHNIFGYLSYFFIFIMLIEPKTAPMFTKGKISFGIIAAVLIFIFNNIGVRFDAELMGLLLANLSVPMLNNVFKKGV